MENTLPPVSFTDLRESLRRVRHFQHLDDTDLDHILSVGQVMRMDAGKVIFTEGDPSSGLFVLLKGRVHLVKLSRDGQESILAVVEPVIMFNEVAALDEGPNPITAVAVEVSVFWWTDGNNFRRLLLEYPTMALGMLRVLATRNRLLVDHYEDLSFRTVPGRAAKLLLDLSENGRKAVDRIQYPNRDLAARISTVPEAFSRALGEFRREGCIRTNRRQLIILEPEKLEWYAQLGSDMP